MSRRLLPTLLVLGAGFAALMVFLGALFSLFLAEDRRGEAEEARSRRALDVYASTSLQRLLAERLEALSRRIDAVQADPLVDDAGLDWLVDGERVLPRAADATRSPTLEATYWSVLSGPTAPQAADDGPRAERLRLLVTLASALSRKDRAGTEATMRAFLGHRARWQLAAADDVPFTLAALELLARHATPSVELNRAVLREGLQGETKLEGLQQQVLHAWAHLAPADVGFACHEVERQSQRAGVPAEDFAARCAGAAAAPPGPLPETEGKTLAGNRVLWRRGAEVRGGTVDVAALTAALRADMLARGLLEPGDTLELAASNAPLPFEAVAVAVRSARFAAAATARREAFESKRALLVVTALLAAFLVGVAVVAQQRKLRFVELKSDFVATVSHELRTPLASLRLMAETLERRLAGRAEAKDYPTRMVAEVDGLSFLVENILSFNRIDKGRWVPRKAPVRLADLQGLLEEDARSSTQVPVQLSFAGWDQLTVPADAELLRLLVLNLQRNARRYNARDPVQLAWTARLGGGRVVLALRDNGVGIPPAAWDTVFREFERPSLERGRGGPGSGLGLALCRRIAVLHGGALRIQASSPEGTTLELTLPAA